MPSSIDTTAALIAQPPEAASLGGAATPSGGLGGLVPTFASLLGAPGAAVAPIGSALEAGQAASIAAPAQVGPLIPAAGAANAAALPWGAAVSDSGTESDDGQLLPGNGPSKSIPDEDPALDALMATLLLTAPFVIGQPSEGVAPAVPGLMSGTGDVDGVGSSVGGEASAAAQAASASFAVQMRASMEPRAVPSLTAAVAGVDRAPQAVVTADPAPTFDAPASAVLATEASPLPAALDAMEPALPGGDASNGIGEAIADTASPGALMIAETVGASPIVDGEPSAAVAAGALASATPLRIDRSGDASADTVVPADAAPIATPAAPRRAPAAMTPSAPSTDDDAAAPLTQFQVPASERRPEAVRAVATATAPRPSEDARLRQPDIAELEHAAAQEQASAVTAQSAPLVATAHASSMPAVAQPEQSADQRAALANPMERMVVQQVSRALVRQGPGGDRSLVIRLTPPELGTVRVEFIERDGAITARIHAEDPAVRQALDRLLPQVRGDLRAADSSVQQITVSAGTQADQGFDGRGFDGRGSPHQQQRQEPSGAGSRSRRGDRPAFSIDGAPAASEPLIPSAPRQRDASGLVDALA